jgi:hypothetical protein
MKLVKGIRDLEKARFSDADIDIFNDYANKMIDLNKQFDINIIDFMRYQNWGIYKNEPVVIDLGFSADVAQRYYSE